MKFPPSPHPVIADCDAIMSLSVYMASACLSAGIIAIILPQIRRAATGRSKHSGDAPIQRVYRTRAHFIVLGASLALVEALSSMTYLVRMWEEKTTDYVAMRAVYSCTMAFSPRFVRNRFLYT